MALIYSGELHYDAPLVELVDYMLDGTDRSLPRVVEARIEALEAFAAELAGRVMELELVLEHAESFRSPREGSYTITLTGALMRRLSRGSS